MKKFLKFFICALLIVSLLSAFAVNSSALSSTTTHETETGTLNYANGKYAYSIDTAASKTSASATLTFGKSIILYAEIKVNVVHSKRIQFENVDIDAITDTYAHASTNNIRKTDGIPIAGDITAAFGTYIIGRALASFEHTLT